MAGFATLYSGSSGNCAVLRQADGGYVLVDMGKSCRQTVAALAQLGLAPQRLQAVLITHEHSDHIAGLPVFLRRWPVPVYAGAATLAALRQLAALPDGVPAAAIGAQGVQVGGFTVRAFATSHDAAGCCGFRIHTAEGSAMAIATDLGQVDEAVYAQLRGCALVALESNYDRVMLQLGPYPYVLKTRIGSSRGHLSNDEAAAVVARLFAEGCTRFALCHLSQQNNTPQKVRAALQARLAAAGAACGAPTLQISPRHTVSDWIEF